MLFTVYCSWPGEVELTEEIDVQAEDQYEARIEIKRRLREEYEPGGQIVEIVERTPWMSGAVTLSALSFRESLK